MENDFARLAADHERRMQAAIEMSDRFLGQVAKLLNARFGDGYATTNPGLMAEMIAFARQLERTLLPEDRSAELEPDAPLRR